jgi:hypothetical protein
VWAHPCCLTPHRRRTCGSSGATHRGVRFDLGGVSQLTFWRQGWILDPFIFIFYFVRLPLCNKYSDVIVTFISIHSVIICVVFFGACMRCTRLCSLNPGVTEVVSDNPYLLTLLWFFSKLILIFSHLFPLYSDYSYLFLLKTNVDFTLWNHVPKVTFRNRGPTLSNKNKTIFIGIYTLECLFLWYLSDLDLWLSVISCRVMSTITYAYTYRHK